MPLFTRENAAEMGRRSAITRRNASAERKEYVVPETPRAEDERKRRMGVQIDLLDADIAKTKNPVIRCRLIAAKAKLWELLYPRPGVLKPARSRDRAPVHAIAPLPIEPASPLVAPSLEQNHNGENVQSQVAA